MMSTAPASNFSFLKSHDEQLVRLGQLAARYFPDDPNTCLLKLRQLAELLAQLTATRVGSYVSSDEKQFELLQRLERQGILTREVGQLFAEVRRAGNDANHALRGDLRAALASLKITRQLGVWYYRTFANLRVPRHDGHDFGLMADSVPNGWRTISLQQRIAIRDAGLVSGMPLPGTVCPGARAIVTAHPHL